MAFSEYLGTAIIFGILSLFTYWIALTLYRLYFHPLANFPGPKFAAASGWYEFYHDIVHHGKFIWQIHRLHEQYGPIVRITPEELHIKDSEYYDEIYAPATKKRDKWTGAVSSSGTPGSIFATVGHNLHRMRRSALNPFFSKRSITSNEPQIREIVEHMCHRLTESAKTGDVIRMDAVFIALTMDIIGVFAFGVNDHYLDRPDFGLEWKEIMVNATSNAVVLRQFPWLLPIMKAPSPQFLSLIDKGAGALMAHNERAEQRIKQVVANNQIGKRAEGTIFQAVLDSDLPPHEKTVERLTDEAAIVVGAGSETTAKSLSFIAFFLADDPAKLRRLREEILTVGPEADGSYNLSKLERLPYLTACCMEGLRMMQGVTTRLPRVAHEPLKYKGWTIPPGTPISQMTYMVNNDAKIFPDPFTFHPERWIEAETKGIRLDRFMVSFSKGSRQCIGINLAWAEMYLAIAYIVTRFDLELFDTTKERDILFQRDWFLGAPSPESQGLRMQIKQRSYSRPER